MTTTAGRQPASSDARAKLNPNNGGAKLKLDGGVTPKLPKLTLWPFGTMRAASHVRWTNNAIPLGVHPIVTIIP